MNMTRRAILKGLGAAPFVAAAGSLLTATSAEAATIDASQFALTSRTGNSYGQFADLNAGLATKLTKVDASAVLADTNRSATRLTSAPSTVDAFAAGFTWESGDQTVDYWIPQGVTTSADAYGSGLYPSSGGRKAVLVSWYFETDPDGDGVDEYPIDKGVRLSFVDMTNASAPTYRHVLLVEPVKTASGEYSFNPVRRHAGGIMWYGNLLYVVDTYKGLRVFDLNTIFQVATAEKDVCGLHTDGQYYGYSYQYVLPQSAAYDNAGKYLRYSAIGLDRASSPDSLVVSEYSVSGTVDYTDGTYNGTGAPTTTPKVVRWNLDYTNRQISSPTASEAVTVGQQKIQGVVSQSSKHYLATSNGSSAGALRTFTSGASTASYVCDLAVGCEDLSFHSSAASGWAYSENVIWNLSEYAGKRYVYAVHADGS
ncbi:MULTISPECIES: hypothetical protein [Streptomyces]|uniref:Tat pathway signal sequence domain protein n=2 Tax=Streptomyces TaxID=1883 RepID=A0A2U9PBR0_STRAS|nr:MULTISPECIES: hypothetical protein [Streptomyces]AWT47067.1 hypothetical protein DMT42_35650 [Streptomyces actuosus]MBM4823752.1 hypothetical protein [Streptomyces actuosus]GHF39341.1 hypothetical protein GCM10018783_04840 [Streptomyces griseosporeus]